MKLYDGIEKDVRGGSLKTRSSWEGWTDPNTIETMEFACYPRRKDCVRCWALLACRAIMTTSIPWTVSRSLQKPSSSTSPVGPDTPDPSLDSEAATTTGVGKEKEQGFNVFINKRLNDTIIAEYFRFILQ